MEPHFKKIRHVGIIPEATAEIQSPEAYYWKNHKVSFIQVYISYAWKKPMIISNSATSHSLTLSPEDANILYMVSGIRVVRKSEAKDQFGTSKSMLKLSEDVQKIAVRSDGRLLAAGSKSGEIYIVDTSSKNILRTLHGHKAAVKALSFLSDKKHLISASDDKSVRAWDLTDGSEIWVSQTNSDFIRACSACPTLGSDSFVTGSYDHSVTLWSLGNGPEPIMKFDHGSPVEAVAVSDSMDCILSAGLSVIKMWSKTGTLLNEITLHHKTISQIGMSKDGKYIFSSSLDRSLKILDVQNLKLLHQFRFPSPVLDFSLSVLWPSIIVNLCCRLAILA